MKKLFLALIITLCITSTHILAEEKPDTNTEDIQDEQTPEAGRKDNSTMMLMAGSAVLFVLVVGVAMRKKNETGSKLYISGVENNADGTYTVKCGIHAKKNLADYTGQSEVQIKKGNAIVIKNNLAQSDEKEALITIVDDQTELDWVLGDESLKINKDTIQSRK